MKANLQDINNVYGRIPDTFEIGNKYFDNYTKFTELHHAHGWRDVVYPEITEGKMLSELHILTNDIVTKELIDLNENT